MRLRFLVCGLAMGLLACQASWGQVFPPNGFFNNSALAPVVDIVQSGAQYVATPVVSADRKYVTISGRAQVAHLVDLQRFEFNFPPGFAGGAFGPGGPPIPAGRPIFPDANVSAPVVIAHLSGGGVLTRYGMTRVEGK